MLQTHWGLRQLGVLGSRAPYFGRSVAGSPQTAWCPPRAAACAAQGHQDSKAAGPSFNSAYGHIACQASVILQPNSTQELAASLQQQLGTARAEGRTVKVRATHT